MYSIETALKKKKGNVSLQTYILCSRYTSVGRTKIVYEIREGQQAQEKCLYRRGSHCISKFIKYFL